MKKPIMSPQVFPLISKRELVKNFTHLHPYNAPWAILQADPIYLIGFCAILQSPKHEEGILLFLKLGMRFLT